MTYNPDNIERHMTSTALGVGALTMIALTGGMAYWVVHEVDSYWQKALGASMGVAGALGVASYLDAVGSRVQRKYDATLELSDQIEVQQTWMTALTPPKPPEESGVFNYAKPSDIPETTWTDFVKNVVNKPELHPHIGIFGNTGTGKTWLAEAIGDLRSHFHTHAGRNPRKVYLSPTCDTKNHEFLGWELIGEGFNTDSLEDFGDYLRATLYARYSKGDDSQEPIIVAPDEYRWTAQKTQGVTSTISDILSIGRKQRLEIILISPSYYVKSLGMEGEGALRENMVMILKGKLMLDRVGTLEKDGLFPKGSLSYITRLHEEHPFSVCLIDDRVMILPDMSKYREEKVNMGMTYQEQPPVLEVPKPRPTYSPKRGTQK